MVEIGMLLEKQNQIIANQDKQIKGLKTAVGVLFIFAAVNFIYTKVVEKEVKIVNSKQVEMEV